MENQELIQILSDLKSDVKVVSNSVAAIEKHLERQNGRIGKAEAAIVQALEERSGNRQKQEDYFKHIEELQTRVSLVEKSEVRHIIDCPQASKIRALEDNRLSTKSVRNWLVASVGITGIVVTIIFTIFKLITGTV